MRRVHLASVDIKIFGTLFFSEGYHSETNRDNDMKPTLSDPLLSLFPKF